MTNTASDKTIHEMIANAQWCINYWTAAIRNNQFTGDHSIDPRKELNVSLRDYYRYITYLN
jgi:hypothetical protein